MAYADIYDVWGDTVGFTPWWGTDEGNPQDTGTGGTYAPVSNSMVPLASPVPSTSIDNSNSNGNTSMVTQQELQQAAAALAKATGQNVTCANYQTVNQGGTIVNDLCTVPGSSDLFDASITNQLSQQQLQAILALQQQQTVQLAQQGISVNPDPSWMINTVDTQIVGTPVTSTTQSQGANTQTPNTVVSSVANQSNTPNSTVNGTNLVNAISNALSQNTTYQSVQGMLGEETTVAGYGVPIWVLGLGGLGLALLLGRMFK